MSVRLATTFNQPINTIADRKQRETRASDRPRRATYMALAAAILAILTVEEVHCAECRATQPKYGRQNS